MTPKLFSPGPIIKGQLYIDAEENIWEALKDVKKANVPPKAGTSWKMVASALDACRQEKLTLQKKIDELTKPAPPVVEPPKQDRITGEIPYDPAWSFVMDHSNQELSRFFDKNINDNVQLGWGNLIPRSWICFEFPKEMQVELSEIMFYDGQGTAGMDPMKSWILDDKYNRIEAFTFKGESYNQWLSFKFSSPIKARYFIMEWVFPIPTELRFIGSYVPHKVELKPSNVPAEMQIGAVCFPWDFLKNNGYEFDDYKMKVADAVHLFRLYIDTKVVWDFNRKVAGFSPSIEGSWRLDDLLKRLKGMGKEVIFCLKDKEGHPDYPEICRQTAIRYGNNKNVKANVLMNDQNWRNNEALTGLGLINKIQLGNENDRWWKNRPDFDKLENLEGYMHPFEYAAIVKKCYDNIKSVDPSIEVILGGTAKPNPYYVLGMIMWCNLFNGGKLVWDAVAYHDYNNVNGGQDWNNEPVGVAPELGGMYERAIAFRRALQPYGSKIKIYMTETGYSVATVNKSQTAVPTKDQDILQVQSDWLLRTSLVNMSAGIDGTTFYWMLDDYNAYWKTDEHLAWDMLMGIASRQDQPQRPAIWELQKLLKALKGCVYVETKQENNSLVYKFKNASGRIISIAVENGSVVYL